MPATYRRPRTTQTAVPDALTALSSEVQALSAATSGQVNGTLRRLPVFASVHKEATGFAPAPTGAVVATATAQVPEGKTACHVMATVSGQAFGDGVQANTPAPRIRVNGALSRPLGSIAQNMDGRYLTGTWSTVLDLSARSDVVVEALVQGKGPAAAEAWLTLDVTLVFTI